MNPSPNATRCRRALAFGLYLALAGTALPVGCRQRQTTGAASASASASGAAPAAPQCASLAPGAAFRIGEPGVLAADGESRDLPFSTEVGHALGYVGGFAVGALAATKTGTEAVIALVGSDGASGRLIRLGPTYGSAAPPRLAASGSELYVVVPGSDASGGTLRLGVIRDPRGAADVTWGAELSEGWDESQAFDVVVGAERAVVAWDRWGERHRGSTVVVSTFDPRDVSAASEPERVTPEEQEAEAPRLVARPGGSWLVYLLRRPDVGLDAGVAAASAALDDGTGTVVDLGRRVLMAQPLDRRGQPIGAPRRVGSEDSHVVVFDVAPGSDGALELVWRDDPTSPGVEGGLVRLAVVRPDGSVQEHVIDSEEVGAGAPALLFDSAPRAPRAGSWLAMGGVTDLTQLVALRPDGKPQGQLHSEPAIGRGDVIAHYGEGLLVATPRGRSVELTVVRCDPVGGSAHPE